MYRDQKLCVCVIVYFMTDIVVENFSLFSKISINQKTLLESFQN